MSTSILSSILIVTGVPGFETFRAYTSGGGGEPWYLSGTWDQTAVDYITRVEAADAQALEPDVRIAYNTFIAGCKTDGIWNAIGASCILAGARTLTGALTPLKGPAPTNNNFVSGDYNRETGLVGNASNKYLITNRASDADGQNDSHIAVYSSSLPSGLQTMMGGSNVDLVSRTMINYVNGTSGYRVRHRNGASPTDTGSGAAGAGFVGLTRSVNVSYTWRVNGSTGSPSTSSASPSNSSVAVFAGSAEGIITDHTDARLQFYSQGANISLSSLRTRLDTLMADLAAAIA